MSRGPGRPRVGKLRSFACPDELWAEAEAAAAEAGIPLSEWLRQAMKAALETQKRPRPKPRA